MILVIGWRRESRHDLRSLVGILSKLQVALDGERIAFCTSVVVAGEKLESRGIGLVEVGSWDTCETWNEQSVEEVGNLEHNFVMLSLKNFRKPEARVEVEVQTGSLGGLDRDRREFIADQSFFGWEAELEIRLR